MGTRGIVPNLVISQRVIDKMATAASHYMEDETGEAMIGIIDPGKYTNGVPTIYVLDTISPDESAVRHMHTFQQGDERQDEIIWWLQENWHARRDFLRETAPGLEQAKWDVPLRYLGDWHKQPGFMIAPSGGDLMTALNWLDDDDNEMEALLVPIVTIGHPATTASSEATVNYLTVPDGDGEFMRVDWWYIHKEVGMFQPINPVIYPADKLPELTRYPWHLINPDRAETEMAQLQGDGLFVSLLLWNADQKLPLEICFMMARQGASKILIIGTHWDYPDRAPFARVAPFRQMQTDDDIYDVFEGLWKESEPVTDPPGWKWTEDTYLVDYVHALETHLGMRPKEAVETTNETEDHDDSEEDQAAVVKIPVTIDSDDESETESPEMIEDTAETEEEERS